MKNRFTGQQIAFALRQAASGTPVSEITRKMGVSEPTFYGGRNSSQDSKVQRSGT